VSDISHLRLIDCFLKIVLIKLFLFLLLLLLVVALLLFFLCFALLFFSLLIFNFSDFSHYKVQLEELEHHVPIVKQQQQHYGEEIKVVNQCVMLVVYITNYIM